MKPTNILVDDTKGDTFGRPYIVDFGLAKKVLSEDDGTCPPFHTRIDQVLGTLPYMCPEHFDGPDEIPDVRSDLYSLGVVFFQVLSGGKPPYPIDGAPEQIADNILHLAPGSLAGANPAIDPDLSAIVGKCLEKDRELRYRSIDDLADDLRRWQRGEAVEARQQHRWYRIRKAVRRQRWTIASLSAIMILLIAGTVSTAVMWQRSDELAVTYRAALEMGSLAKMGSVARDEDRIPDALTLWNQALTLADDAPVQHEEVDRMRYEVLHRLGEFHLGEENPEQARAYCIDAIAVAERYADENLAWRRRLGFAEILRGRLALADNEYETALRSFTRSVEIRREFVEQDESSVSHQMDLAHALSLAGRPARNLKHMTEALDFYTEAYDIRLALHEAYPESADHSIELVYCELKLAVWHMSQEDGEGDAKSLMWLDRAQSRLASMRSDGLCDDRPRDCRRLAANLDKNRGIVERRTSQLMNP
jgi:tetratricopeptide (TPR) repeat protein